MLFPMYFTPLNFQQANPALTGIAAGQAMRAQQLQNQMNAAKAQYIKPTLQQQLQSQELANQLATIKNQYAPSQLQSQIGLLQAQANAQNALPGLYGAQAQEALQRGGLYGTQANLIGQQTPYLVQQAQGSIFRDPIAQRAFELRQAGQMGLAPELESFGIPVPGVTPVVPQGGAPGASQGVTPVNPNSGALSPPGTYQGAAPLAPLNGALSNATPAGTPNMYGGNALQNYGLFGSPYNPIEYNQLLSAAKTAGSTGVTVYNDAQTKAAQAGDLGNQISNLVDQYNSAYDKTKLTGSALGHLYPVSSAAQEADNASQNMAATVAKLVAGGRVTNYEMQYVGTLKPNRTLNPQASQMVAGFLKQKSIRMEEEQNFLNASRSYGISPQTAQTLWQNYNNQRPVYNFKLNKPNTQFQKSWRDFLTPQAIQAAQSGQTYVPLPTFNNVKDATAWFYTLPPADQVVARQEMKKVGENP